MPGKNELRWLIGCFLAFILFWSSWGYLVPATDSAPAPSPAAVVAAPAPTSPPALAPLAIPIRTEPIFAFSARIEPVETSPPAATTTAAAVVPEGPAAAPHAPDPARCARYVYRAKFPKRESIFDDMDEKYQAELAKVNRSSSQMQNCLRKVSPGKGG